MSSGLCDLVQLQLHEWYVLPTLTHESYVLPTLTHE